MANPLADALVASITQGFDPMNRATAQLVEQHLAQGRETLNNTRLDTMQRLQRLIEEGKGNDIDGNVLAAYNVMLESYSKLPV